MTAQSPGQRVAGFGQGMMLLLPVTTSVVGVTIFTATAALMAEHFRPVPSGDYLVQLLITMPAICIVLFSPLAGWLADRYGRRLILLISMVVYAFVGTAPVLLQNIYWIVLTRFFVGVCEAMIMVASTTMIGDYFKGAARERWLAGQTALASLSSLLFIWAGGQLGAAFGWQGPFLIYGYSLVLALAVARLTWEPSRQDGPAATATVADEVLYPQLPVIRMTGICLITVVASIMFYSTVTQNANALAELGLHEPGAVGNLSALASMGVPIGTVLFWGIARLGVGWLIFLSFGLIGAGFAWMGAAGTASAYAIAANLQQIGCGLALPTFLVWATRGLAPSIRGRGTGIWQAAFCLGQFLSGVALTFMAKKLGGLLPTFSALAVVSLIAAALALLASLVALRRPTTPKSAPKAASSV